VEGSETINLTLSNLGGGAVLGARSTAVATITSEDKGGTLSLSAALYSESEAGPTALITVTRKGGSASDVTLDYAATPGTAVPGVHFVPVSGTLVFASGETSKTFSVLVLDDQAPSGNKTVNLELSNAGGGGTLVAPATAVLWIVDSQ
jgi:Calx-beta domain